MTLDGEPVPNVMLEFFPLSGIGPMTIGRSDANGRYTAVVAPTKVSVMLSATKVVGKAVDPSTPGGGEMDDVRNVLPERYGSHKTSGVTAKPVAGKTVTVDFHLKSTADQL